MKTQCELHGKTYWEVPYHKDQSFCRKCLEIRYNNASVCPTCGTKKGFAWGTGDCQCSTEPDVGF